MLGTFRLSGQFYRDDMADILLYRFMPLGLIQPTPGIPLDIFQNYPAFRTDKVYTSANLLVFQAHWLNTGRSYIGQTNLDVGTNTGINWVLAGPEDGFTIGTQALNIFEIVNFRVDVENMGDGVLVSMFIA